MASLGAFYPLVLHVRASLLRATSCHFVLARDGYTTRYVFPPSFASLKIYDRLIDTWKRGGERLVNFPTDRPATSSRPKFFHPTYIYLNSPPERCAPGITEEGGRGGGWLLIFCKRRRPLCEILLEAKRANTVFQY